MGPSLFFHAIDEARRRAQVSFGELSNRTISCAPLRVTLRLAGFSYSSGRDAQWTGLRVPTIDVMPPNATEMPEIGDPQL